MKRNDKIIIDGVRYVALAEIQNGSCQGCYFFGSKKCPDVNGLIDCNQNKIILIKHRKIPIQREEKQVNELLSPEGMSEENIEKLPTGGSGLNSNNNNNAVKEMFSNYIVAEFTGGRIYPAKRPHQHESKLDALKEAERLVKKTNKQYIVMEVVASVKPVTIRQTLIK
jgi:hypothetical protein